MEEIKEHALAQLAASGPEALSLNAIARAMGMSGPALYRYFASREELLGELVTNGYDELAEVLTKAVQAGPSAGHPAAEQVRALGHALRTWALGQPHRYRLIFATRYGSGFTVPERTVPASHRAMVAILSALSGVQPQWRREWSSTPELDAQLRAWMAGKSEGPTPPAGLLQAGILLWTRLHGVLSLELEGVFASMGIDAGLMYDQEIERFITL
jgi:AcrR family transcriptional regulator